MKISSPIGIAVEGLTFYIEGSWVVVWWSTCQSGLGRGIAIGLTRTKSVLYNEYVPIFLGGHYGSWESTCALIHIRQIQSLFRYKLEYTRSWPNDLKDGSTKENKSPTTLQRGWWGFLIKRGCRLSPSNYSSTRKQIFIPIKSSYGEKINTWK